MAIPGSVGPGSETRVDDEPKSYKPHHQPYPVCHLRSQTNPAIMGCSFLLRSSYFFTIVAIDLRKVLQRVLHSPIRHGVSMPFKVLQKVLQSRRKRCYNLINRSRGSVPRE